MEDEGDAEEAESALPLPRFLRIYLTLQVALTAIHLAIPSAPFFLVRLFFGAIFLGLTIVGVQRHWRPMWFFLVVGSALQIVIQLLPSSMMWRERGGEVGVLSLLEAVMTLALLLPRSSRDWFFAWNRAARADISPVDAGAAKVRGCVLVGVALVACTLLLTVCGAWIAASNSPR